MKKVLIVLAVIFMMISCPAQTVTINDLTEATTVNTTDLGPIWQGGVTKKLSFANWNTWFNATTRTIGGTWTFSNTITGAITGNAGTVTNGVYTTGSYSNPSWLSNLALSKINVSGEDPADVLMVSSVGTLVAYPFSGDVTISDVGVTTIGTGKVTSAMILNESITTSDIDDGTITYQDISSNAQIQATQLETALNGQIIISTTPGVPDWQTISGDISLSNTGVVDITDNLSDNFIFSGKITQTNRQVFTPTRISQWNAGSQTLAISNLSRFNICDIGQTNVTITDITSADDGEIITLMVSLTAQEIMRIDHGTEIKLTGNVDYDMEAGDNITLMYDSVQDVWFEIARLNL